VAFSFSLRLSFAALFMGLGAAHAAAAPPQPSDTEPYVTRGKSGLPLPRFVSLKSAKVNSRIGPGVTYAVDWRYMKAGLPMEIIQEFDNWRRVRDSDGAVGQAHGHRDPLAEGQEGTGQSAPGAGP
jgi:SH3-like domain-containing protein